MLSGFRKLFDKAAWNRHYEQKTYQVIFQFLCNSTIDYAARFNKSGNGASEIYTKSSKWI